MVLCEGAIRICEPRLGLEGACRRLLNELPDWFGIPEANDEYVAFVAGHPTWSAVDDAGTVIGLLAPLDHAESTEIYLVCVAPNWRRHGVGRSLVGVFEQDAIRRVITLVQVKTLGPSHPDEGYTQTRRFYAALGYRQLEEFHDLWPGTPALLMVKPLPTPGGEASVVRRTPSPITSTMIAAALGEVGVTAGSVVIVHTSLSRLGWVVGDAHAVVEALLAAVGPDGTIVMPAHSSLSDPGGWVNPPIPQEWHEVVRAETPAFDPALTPRRAMGRVVECFSHLAGVLHSGHPAVGFLAYGPQAEAIVGHHPLNNALDDASPLGRLYELHARIVLIGVGHENNTSLHLAEHRADYAGKQSMSAGVAMLVDGVRRWVTYDDLDLDESDFPDIGAAYAAAGGDHVVVPLGFGQITACSMPKIVDFATDALGVTFRAQRP